MIAEHAADLLAKIRSVAALADRTSMTVGGRSSDPGMVKIPLPACWLTFGREDNDEQSFERGPSSGVISTCTVMGTYAATVMIPYTTDDDLLNVQFPMLEQIINTIHGTEAPGGMQWRFLRQVISNVYPDRLAYEQRYTVTYVHQTPTT